MSYLRSEIIAINQGLSDLKYLRGNYSSNMFNDPTKANHAMLSIITRMEKMFESVARVFDEQARHIEKVEQSLPSEPFAGGLAWLVKPAYEKPKPVQAVEINYNDIPF